MKCNCGGATEDHEVIRMKKVIGNYARCDKCRNVKWTWKADDFDSFEKGTRFSQLTKKNEFIL